MKLSIHPFLRPPTLAAFSLALAATSVFAQTTLLSDSFDTVGVGDGIPESPPDPAVPPFNDSTALGADQTGTLAPLDYARVVTDFGWGGYVQRGNGAQMLLAGYDAPYNGQVFVSLNHNFADDANTLNSPLEIKFNLDVTDSADPENWGTFAVGSSQNVFVNDAANKFSSLFRDSGGTQQFASAMDVTDIETPFTFTDGDEITVLISDTAGTGSAFNGNGSVAKIFVNDVLQFTSPDLGLTASDGYISFQAFGTKAYYDNLSITATAVLADYDNWANSFAPPIGLPAADDDNDGLTNQEEYAFGLLPNNGASVNPIAAPLDESTGSFSYTRRATPTSTGLTYSVWFSENLTDWTEDTGATEGAPTVSGEVEIVPVTLSELPGNPLPAKLFILVRAD